jgi:hypothetical protein
MEADAGLHEIGSAALLFRLLVLPGEGVEAIRREVLQAQRSLRLTAVETEDEEQMFLAVSSVR